MALDLISTIQAFMWKRDLPPIDLHLFFEKLGLKTQVWKLKLDELNFLSTYFELDFYCLCSLQISNLK
jgi:hypothetical protein